MTTQELVEGIYWGRRVYLYDFVGWGSVTKVMPHEFTVRVTTGPNKDEVATYPFTSLPEAFEFDALKVADS